MSGRKLRCLNLFKFFAEHVDMSYATTVVTTMWNELHTEQQLLRALGRLEAIEDQFWKVGDLNRHSSSIPYLKHDLHSIYRQTLRRTICRRQVCRREYHVS